MWHWAHHARPHCDPWWEPETDWHRAWKNRFPPAWREVIAFDPITGEKHIADVKTDTGFVLEFQNSPITPSELASREAFYGHMAWIINASRFSTHFAILDALPAPTSTFAQDLVFFPQRADRKGRCFYRKSENPEPHVGGMVEIHDMTTIADKIARDYDGHHLFDWRRPRTVWFATKKFVYFDFGDEDLWELVTYDEHGLRAIRHESKDEFVTNYTGLPEVPPAR